MSELEPATGQAVEASAGVLVTVVTYVIVITQLAIAGARLRWVGESVRATYRYVEGCARSTDRLAEQMAGLTVDRDTVGEHHQAATVMRMVLGHAEQMAVEAEELGSLFTEASAGHQADYGPIADTARAMPVPMADASFYSNR